MNTVSYFFYEVAKEGKHTSFKKIDATLYRPDRVAQVGATYVITVRACNPKHAQVVADGILTRFLRKQTAHEVF